MFTRLKALLAKLVLAAVLLLGGGFASLANPPAQAGTNGQQLEIVSRDAAYLYVSGYNQNNQHIIWNGIQHPAYDTKYNGYWWKGPLSIDYYNSAGQHIGGADYSVPTSQSGDYYVIRFDA